MPLFLHFCIFFADFLKRTFVKDVKLYLSIYLLDCIYTVFYEIWEHHLMRCFLVKNVQIFKIALINLNYRETRVQNF